MVYFMFMLSPRLLEWTGNVIYVYVVPNEGTAWDKMQIFILQDNNKDYCRHSSRVGSDGLQ